MNHSEDNGVDQKEKTLCVYCGKEIKLDKAWPHVEGNFSLGVRKIDYFCSNEHKYEYFNS